MYRYLILIFYLFLLTREAYASMTIDITGIDKSKFPVIKVTSIVTENNNIVDSLHKEDFFVYEDKKQVTITDFEPPDKPKPINIMLVIDGSGSMEETSSSLNKKIDDAKITAGNLSDLISGEEHLGIIYFNNDKFVNFIGLESDKNKINNAIDSIPAPLGGTPLIDAAYEGIKQLKKLKHRKVLFLISDGIDNASKVRQDKLIKEANLNNISIYCAGIGGYFNSNQKLLNQISTSCYGKTYITPDASTINEFFLTVVSSLRKEYSFTYKSTNPDLNGNNRNIEIFIKESFGNSKYSPGGCIPQFLDEKHQHKFILSAVFLSALLMILLILPSIILSLIKYNIPADSPAPVTPLVTLIKEPLKSIKTTVRLIE